jgi:AcrR family transcriptional regulator
MQVQTTRARNGSRSRADEILDAARELFFEKGYRGTTIQQIASRAGYSKRTVYLDYVSKDELFMTICAEGGEFLLQQLMEVPQDEFPVERSIEPIIDAYVGFSRDQAEYFRMIFNESTPGIIANCSKEIRARVADLERACLGVVVSWAKRAMREGLIARLDPWAVAGIVVGSATGIILLSMGGRQSVFTREKLESLVEMAVRTLSKGLRPSDALAEADPRGQEA